jgi:hypothetical protein
MKKFLCIALILAVCSFSACKKSEEAKAQPGKQNTTAAKRAPGQKRIKRGKAVKVAGLQIYNGDKLAVTIPMAEYATIMTTPIKVNGKDYKAVLLTDLFKKHNITGKSVTLKGPAKAATLTWEQITKNPIYIYPVKNRLMLYYEGKGLETAKLPGAVQRITVGEATTAAPAGGTQKVTKKAT